MRSALICVFFALVVHRRNVAGNNFRPTPIPLNDWQYSSRVERAGTLQEIIDNDSTTAVAVIPAHYWEDALRHSVYLSLVRDKIDQLIAKGDVISPDSKPDTLPSKESDDLWEKIKTAPFDRLAEEEPASYGDVTIMAKGRLMEEKGGFRFTEDERSKEKCSEEKCMNGVKAFWSVKRVRQRDDETSPGGYHYELTFSVMSPLPKKQRKPYENSIRTFTVRETVPERVVDNPQEQPTYELISPTTYRPDRAIWFHKNISPVSRHYHRRQQNALDRLFFSLFSDDDDEYDTRQRYRPPPQPHQPPQVAPVYAQHSKVGYVGQPSDQQKRLTPYPYKLPSHKYTRPLPTPPIPPPHMHQHYVLDAGSFGPVNAYGSHPDHRYVPPGTPIKTTRPAVLPTPLPPLPSHKNSTNDDKIKHANYTEAPEIITSTNTQKPRSTSKVINYLTDHVRPPVYNAPPGVFVTMDRKPFKPMPPLKYIHSSKPVKTHRPIDFRPSPQVLDMQQFSEPDPAVDTAFRPITWNYSDSNATEKIEVAETGSIVNTTRKSTTTTKDTKLRKKHENMKPNPITTATPEIITAGINYENEDDVEWDDPTFTKTTPMKPQKEIVEEPSNTTSSTTTSTTTSSTTSKRRTTTTTETPEVTTTTKRKRTRPTPKFKKTTEKTKKYERTSITNKPTETNTKTSEVKTTQDLTPQASSSALKQTDKTTKADISSSFSTTTTTTTTTTIKPSTTANPPTTSRSSTTSNPSTTSGSSTTSKPSTTAKTVANTTTSIFSTNSRDKITTTQPKTKNRFRESTLIHKGTSVKHDKWSATTAATVEKYRLVLTSNKHPPRRKGSNFMGYQASSTERNKDPSTSTTQASTKAYKATSLPSHTYENENTGEFSDSSNYQDEDEEQETENSDTKDHTEYPQSTSTALSENEITDEEPNTEQTVTSQYSTPKNKTKCKKKLVTTTDQTSIESFEETTSTSTLSTTTESRSTSNFFDDIFGSFPEHVTEVDEPEKQETQQYDKFVKIDDDLQEFLDSLEKNEDRDLDDHTLRDYVDNEELFPHDETEEEDEDASYHDDEEIVSPRDNNKEKRDCYFFIC